MTRSTLPALIAILSLTTPLLAQDKGVEGAWGGGIKVPGGELPLVVHIEKGKDGSLKATSDSPTQGAFGMAVDSIELKGRTLTFEQKRIRGKYEGTLNAEGTEIAGTWTQNGPKPLNLTKGDPEKLAAPVVSKEIRGTWEGTIQGAAIRVVLNVTRLPDGTVVLAFDSPDQGVNGIPINALTLKEKMLTFEVKSVGGSYEGTLDADSKEIKGKWKQGGASLGLDLKKTDKPREARRPQTPKPPFPYRAEEVAYKNEAAGVKLAGTLTLPKGDGPFPAVILITGSGPQDRDETLFGHKPFLVLADALTRRGIAVLRVDDRGVGGSTGDPATATTDDYAGDVLAGVSFLKTQKSIDPKRIGLMGHSEGGVIAPIVAARAPEDVAFIVLLAGTGVRGDELLKLQRRLMSKAAGVKDEELDKVEAASSKMVAVVMAEKDPAVAEKKLRAVLREVEAAEPEAKGKVPIDDNKPLDPAVARINTPWFRYFLAFDPRPTLAKVRCPVLAVNGSKDLQVDADQNVPEIAKALQSAGNSKVTTRVFPGLNHLFQTCKTGSVAEYGQIEETIAPEALTAVADWVAKTTGLK